MTVYSVTTETTDITKATRSLPSREGQNERTDKEPLNARGAEVHFALGRDGHALGHQPYGGAGTRAAFPLAAAAAGGRDFRHAGGGAFEREHQPARAGRGADRARGGCVGGPAGAFCCVEGGGGEVVEWLGVGEARGGGV